MNILPWAFVLLLAGLLSPALAEQSMPSDLSKQRHLEVLLMDLGNANIKGDKQAAWLYRQFERSLSPLIFPMPFELTPRDMFTDIRNRLSQIADERHAMLVTIASLHSELKHLKQYQPSSAHQEQPRAESCQIEEPGQQKQRFFKALPFPVSTNSLSFVYLSNLIPLTPNNEGS